MYSLTDDDICAIRQAQATTETMQEVGQRFGITREMVRLIWEGQVYRKTFNRHEAEKNKLLRQHLKAQKKAPPQRPTAREKFIALERQLAPVRVVRIENYPDYAVSEDGFVWSLKGLGEPYRLQARGTHRTLVLHSTTKSRTTTVPRLVAEAFLPCPDPKLVVRPKDGNLDNAHVDNLEWVKAMSWMEREKLTAYEVQVIRYRNACGESQADLAREYNVNPMTIFNLVHHKTWVDVP